MKNLLSYASENSSLVLSHFTSAIILSAVFDYLKMIYVPMVVLILVMTFDYFTGIFAGAVEKMLTVKLLTKGF